MRRKRATNSRAAGENSGLWPPSKLIATEGDQIHAGREAVGDQRFSDAAGAQVDDAAAPQVLVDRDAALASQRGEIRAIRGVQ